MRAMLMFLFVSLMVSFSAWGADVPVEGFEWLNSVILFLQSIPAIGPYLAKFFQAMAILSAVLTALAAFLETLLTIPEVIAKVANADEIAKKIKDFKEKYLPWIKYFSMFNVQKKKA